MRKKQKEEDNDSEIRKIYNNDNNNFENIDYIFNINNNNNEEEEEEKDNINNNDKISEIKIDNMNKYETDEFNEIDKNQRRKKSSGEKLNELLINSKPIKSKNYVNNKKIFTNRDKNQKEDNIYEDDELNIENLDKENHSNLKLQSPTMNNIPKIIDLNNILTLNNKNDKINEIQLVPKDNKKGRQKKSKSRIYKHNFKSILERGNDTKNQLVKKGSLSTNEDTDLIIDFNFLHLIDNTDDEIEKREYNNMPYLKALRIDKRSNLEIIISVFANEIGFLNLFCYRNPYSHLSLTISIYLFELLLDLTLNCFLYTDDVVSEKYHNDGNLSMFTSLSLSFISNIISSIAVFIIAKLTNYAEILEIIIQTVKDKKKYFDNIIRLMKYMKIRLGIFYFLQLSFILIMTYYLFIFCAIYNKSQVSITINYIIGALTSLAISVGLTVIISVFRIISLKYHFNRLYNVSRFLYDKF